MNKLVVFLTFCLLSFSSQAQMLSGNDLHHTLNSDLKVDKALSLGFVVGVYDTLQGFNHCAPNGVTAGQIRDMVKQFLEDGPSIRDMPANEIILAVFKDTWPCDTTPKPSSFKTT